MSDSLLILGASTRAAAFSALTAGFSPICADQFADADLADRCPVTAVTAYPAGLERVAENAAAGPWMYTGGLENYPKLVDGIAARRPLLGNASEVLRRIRDPAIVHDALGAAGILSPEVRESSRSLPRDGTWLRKSRRGSGGVGIEFWSKQSAPARKDSPDYFFQRFVAGKSCAAIYLAVDGRARFLGATEQILLPHGDRLGDFRYAGSLGPLPPQARRDARLAKVGEVLAREFDLRGLFGVDFIDDGVELWPIEVNPRYTASIEILERALSFSAVGWHVAACRLGAVSDEPLLYSGIWISKRVLYAEHDLLVGQGFAEQALAARDAENRPAIADIPPADTPIEEGRPVMTVFASATTRDAALLALNSGVLDWSERLRACRTSPISA